MGQIHVADWLRSCHARPRDPHRVVAFVVGSHHGTNPTLGGIIDVHHALADGDSLWPVTHDDEAFNAVAAYTGIDKFLPRWVSAPMPIQIQVPTKTLVTVTEGIASSESLFP
ncbi:CRISPR-associated protein Cas3 [Propionibacterium sp. NM47_B9-13]|uniref:HD Cas3-type domain-containing protein n=2 Tax=Cutibacterium modestum TaxID=2559073 RepID=A0AAD1KNF1_9ACTN|nr:HD domain-containing protein [Cutibacterium modestum]TGY28016.1 CRISPR-associated protein Cas3 [Propionibacterium sp. NM47_B9-13]AOH46404.1 CRISPR-associated protein Cas3 [Cutibacterium modestum]EFS74282.1 hypothetical protein HMPREF9621_01313 [Cutibacterium modestum HL037PA2]EFS91910.1 hypothetical protein HMPREF9607_01883 [Cutibacterium modestum HL044PA1]EFT16176.1 hypothetical protein HMPREF9622_00737 [Cutibacterium modestum HL037PA3]